MESKGGIEIMFKCEHDKTVLTNANGDTYTTREEELIDFLISSRPITPVNSQEDMDRYALQKQATLLRGIISNGANSIDFLTKMVNVIDKQLESLPSPPKQL